MEYFPFNRKRFDGELFLEIQLSPSLYTICLMSRLTARIGHLRRAVSRCLTRGETRHKTTPVQISSAHVHGIPTGFRRRAQGCEGTELPCVTARYSASTRKGLRLLFVNRRNPFRAGKVCLRFTQGSDVAATLGFEAKSRWDLPKRHSPSSDVRRLAASSWRIGTTPLSHVSSHRAHKTNETRSLTLSHAW